MAKRPAAEPCMICETFPCSCKAKKRTPPKRRTPHLKDQSSASREDGTKRTLTPKTVKADISDLLLQDAIRNLEPLLSPEDKARFSSVLTTESSPADKVRVWQHRKDNP